MYSSFSFPLPSGHQSDNTLNNSKFFLFISQTITLFILMEGPENNGRHFFKKIKTMYVTNIVRTLSPNYSTLPSFFK